MLLQGAVLMLRAGNAANFSKLEVFSLIVAAAVHDLAHPGDHPANCSVLQCWGLTLPAEAETARQRVHSRRLPQLLL